MMTRSLWSGATGMRAMQFYIDSIAHDLTNVNTTGYKKKEVNFQDLLYQQIRAAGMLGGTDNAVNIPVGINVGLGVRVAGTTPIMTGGPAVETGNWTDMMIMERQTSSVRNFFQIDTGNGTFAYTRDGNFRVDSNGNLVTVDGYYLSPQPGQVASNATDVTVSPEGMIRQKLPGQTTYEDVGQIQLFTFINPAGLEPRGKNLWTETEASGAAQQGTPGLDGYAEIASGFLEQSNVDAISEMVNMISAQRAYEFNSKSITTSDEMLQTINQLKR